MNSHHLIEYKNFNTQFSCSIWIQKPQLASQMHAFSFPISTIWWCGLKLYNFLNLKQEFLMKFWKISTQPSTNANTISIQLNTKCMRKKPFGSCIDLSILRRAWTRNNQRELISCWMFDFAHNIAENWRFFFVFLRYAITMSDCKFCWIYNWIIQFGNAESRLKNIQSHTKKSWRTLIHRRRLTGAMEEVFFFQLLTLFSTKF